MTDSISTEFYEPSRCSVCLCLLVRRPLAVTWSGWNRIRYLTPELRPYRLHARPMIWRLLQPTAIGFTTTVQPYTNGFVPTVRHVLRWLCDARLWARSPAAGICRSVGRPGSQAARFVTGAGARVTHISRADSPSMRSVDTIWAEERGCLPHPGRARRVLLRMTPHSSVYRSGCVSRAVDRDRLGNQSSWLTNVFKGLTQLWKSRRIYPKYMPKCSVGSTDHVCKFLLKKFV